MFMNLIRSRDFWLVTALACLRIGASAQTGSGNAASIFGKAQDENGKPLSKALIEILAEPIPPANGAKLAPFTFFHTTALTKTDGSFLVSGLPAGRFRVCALANGINSLGSCPVFATRKLVDVGAAQNLNVGTLVSVQGYRLQVRVNDPTGLIVKNDDKNAGKNSGAFLLHGAFVGANYIPAKITASDALGRSLEMLVPFDTAFTFSLQSKFYVLNDDKGAAADPVKGVQIPLQVKSGSSIPVKTLTVTGVTAASAK